MSEELSKFAKTFTVVQGFIRKRDYICLIAHLHKAVEKKIPSAQILVYSTGRKWIDGGRYKWQGCSIASLNDGIIALGRDGEIATWSPKGKNEEIPLSPQKTHGPFRGITNIDGVIFAYGMQRHVFRRVAQSNWSLWTKGFPKFESQILGNASRRASAIASKIGGINALAGISAKNLYAVGMNGEIWFNDGRRWAEVDSPTNLNLYDAVLGDNGRVYVCGQSGTLFFGVRDEWLKIPYEGAGNLDFYSIRLFKDKIYLADGQSLMVLDEGILSLVDMGVDGVVPCHQIHVSDDMLIAIAGKEIFVTTDGRTWTSII